MPSVLRKRSVVVISILLLLILFALFILYILAVNSKSAKHTVIIHIWRWVGIHWLNPVAITAWATSFLALATFLLYRATKREKAVEESSVGSQTAGVNKSASGSSSSAQSVHTSDPDSPSTTESRSESLPLDTLDFTGRANLIEDICKFLSSSEDSTSTEILLHGPPGVGKTTLAIHMAHHVADKFPDGRIFVELRDTDGKPRDPYIVLGELLTYLGISAGRIPRDRRLRVALYRSTLKGKRCLIIFDNAVGEDQLRDFLIAGRSTRILITSRSTLGSLPSCKRYLVYAFDISTGLEFFSKIVGQDRIHNDPKSAEHIVRLCGGLPLSLRITGAKIVVRPHLDLADAKEGLNEGTGRLDELALGDLRSRSVLSWSYTDLSKSEKRLFRRLAIIAVATFPSWVASVLLDIPLSEAERTLQGLVDSHLIEAKERDRAHQIRYGFHDLIRELAIERLREEDSTASVQSALERLASNYLMRARLAREASATAPLPGDQEDRMFPSQREALAWLAVERPALVSLVEQTSGAEMWQLSADMASCIAPYLEETSNWFDLEIIYKHSMDAALVLRDRKLEGAALHGLGVMLRDRGDFHEAAERLHAALIICQEVGDLASEARLRRDVAMLYQFTGQFEAAIAEFREALRLYDAESDITGVGWALRNLGQVYRDLGEFSQAEESLDKALAVFDSMSDRRGRGWAMRSLGEIYRLQERYEDSESELVNAVSILANSDDIRGRAWALRALGDLRLQQSRAAEAETVYGEALRIFRELGDRRGIAWTSRSLGDLYRIRGEYSLAVASFSESRDFFHESGALEWEAIALRGLAETYRDEGSFEGAIEAYQTSIEIFHQVADNRREQRALLDLAQVCNMMNRPEDAELARNRAHQIADGN